jgi:hypothetical protein
VYALPFHRPAALAIWVTMLDHMAQERFILWIVDGSIPTEFLVVNADLKAGGRSSSSSNVKKR